MSAPSAPLTGVKAVAVGLLYTHLAALPHKEYGVINMLPFAHDSEQVRMIKRHVCEAIVNLLDNHNLLATDAAEPVVNHSVAVKCQTCATELVSLATDENGTAMVDARGFIAGLAATNPACQHGPLTIQDLRAHMEREFYAQDESESNSQ